MQDLETVSKGVSEGPLCVSVMIQVQRIKDQWKDVDARPIKKVAEAKQKQKRRKVAVMAKLTKQATSALNNEEETKEKRESILRKLVSKNAGKTKQSKVRCDGCGVVCDSL